MFDMNKKLAVAALIVAVVLIAAAAILMPLLKKVGQEPPGQGGTSKEKPAYTYTKDWLSTRNIYFYANPPLDYLEAVDATGVTWSVYWGGVNDPDAEYLDSLHSNGFKVCSNFPTVQGNVTEDQTLRESAHCVGLNGQPAGFFGDQYAMCHNNPLWQKFLKQRVGEQIDGKADAIHIDEIGSIGLFSNGGFCDYCLSAFNSYLSGRYSAEQLRGLFLIDDISSFNYRTYLLAQGAQSVWEDTNQKLINEYRKSQFLSNVSVMRDLIQYARGYAGRDLLISANTYDLQPDQLIYLPYLDFAVFEMPIGDLPKGKLFVNYLLGEAMEPSKPLVGFPDIFDLARLSEGDWWLWRHWLAESFACGASFLLPYNAYAYGGGQYNIPVDKVTAYTSFFSAHPSYYENTSRLAKAALLFDLDSTLFNQFSWQAQLAWENFKETGRVMQEAHIPFEVVFVGDGEFVNRPITLGSLEKYSVAIVPRGYQLATATAEVLHQYSQRGGHVIWSDHIPDGSDLISEVRGMGADLGLETNASSDLSIMTYKRGDALLLHLINYNYDKNLRDFVTQSRMDITVAIPAGVNLSGKTLKLLSPDAARDATIDFTVNGDKVTFTIPSVHEYSVASFE